MNQPEYGKYIKSSSENLYALNSLYYVIPKRKPQRPYESYI